MRVLTVLHAPVWGGLHNLALRLRAPLLERGWDLSVLIPNDCPDIASRFREASQPFEMISLHRLRRSRSIRVQAEYLRAFPGEVRALRSLIRSGGSDVVQTSGLMNQHVAVAARLERRPVVMQLNSSAAPATVRRLAFALTLPAASVMVEGDGVARAHAGLSVCRARPIRFYPPVDANAFRPDRDRRRSARHALGISDSARVVGTLGNYTRQKGHDMLIEGVRALLARFSDVHLLVLGAHVDSNRDWYSRHVLDRVCDLSAETRSRIHFVQPGHSPADWLPALDVFALTSRAEGVATATLEAMACGLPVVAHDIGSVSEAVSDSETGFVVSPSSHAFSLACELLLEDAMLRQRMGEAGRTRVIERFSVDACVEAHEAAYLRAIGSR